MEEDGFVLVVRQIFYPFVVCQFLLNCWADAAPTYQEQPKTSGVSLLKPIQSSHFQFYQSTTLTILIPNPDNFLHIIHSDDNFLVHYLFVEVLSRGVCVLPVPPHVLLVR